MKPTFQLLFGFIIIVFTASCQSTTSETLNQLRETKFPSFEEVYTHVNKQIKGPGVDCQFGLAKKTDGYYLKIALYDKSGKFKEPKFLKAWDSSTQKYLTLDIEKYYTPDYSDYDQGLAMIRNSGKSFELNYFYGYPDYTRDLIELMKDREDLSSKELEMLGRAYSAEACDYIHPNQSGSEITLTRELADPMYEKIAANRISSFKQLSAKSLACYQKIKDTDPDYKTTIIEDLDLKVNNDLMNHYLLLKSVQEDSEAAAALNKVNYKANDIAYAKELLDDCAQNGILITSGDNDTFPLWFVQENLHYRNDVIVINHSLLQTPWYFDYIKHTTPIKSELSIKEYQYYYTNYVVLKEVSDEAVEYPEWLSLLRRDQEKKTRDYGQEISWMNIPEAPHNLLIPIQGTTHSFASKRSYLFGVDLCLLDLINANKDRRFYTTSIYVFSETNLKEHLAKRDLTYELLPGEVSSNWDKESNKLLNQSLQKHPVKITSGKMNDIEKGMVYAKCFDWILMPEEEMEANQLAFELFLKQLPFKTIIESGNAEIQELYAIGLMNMQSKKAGQFLDAYAPTALAMIDAIDDQKTLSEKDAEILEGIHSIYIDRKNLYNMNAPQPLTVSEIQKNVEKAVRSKVKILSDNPLNKRNLSWTWKTLSRMN